MKSCYLSTTTTVLEKWYYIRFMNNHSGVRIQHLRILITDENPFIKKKHPNLANKPKVESKS